MVLGDGPTLEPPPLPSLHLWDRERVPRPREEDKGNLGRSLHPLSSSLASRTGGVLKSLIDLRPRTASQVDLWTPTCSDLVLIID